MMTKWQNNLIIIFFFLADQVSVARFVVDFFYLVIAVFGCRILDTRFCLRLLRLKFGGLWGALCLHFG